MNADDWVRRYAAELGIEAPSEEEQHTLLELAGTAARASERTAAPISCWVAARAGFGAKAALAAAEKLARDLGIPAD